MSANARIAIWPIWTKKKNEKKDAKTNTNWSYCIDFKLKTPLSLFIDLLRLCVHVHRHLMNANQLLTHILQNCNSFKLFDYG